MKSTGTPSAPPKRTKFKLPAREPPISTSASAVRKYSSPLFSHTENEELREDAEEEEESTQNPGALDQRPLENANFGIGQPSGIQSRIRRANSGGTSRSPGPEDGLKKPGFAYEDPVVSSLMGRKDRKDAPSPPLPGAKSSRRSFSVAVRGRGTHGALQKDVIDTADPDANFYQLDALNRDIDHDDYADRSPDLDRLDDQNDDSALGASGSSSSYFSAMRRKSLQNLVGEAEAAPFSPNSPAIQINTTGLGNAGGVASLAPNPESGIAGDASDFGKKKSTPAIITTAPPPASPDSDEARERMEWQNMLSAVIGGDVFKGEKRRIGGEMSYNEQFRREKGDAFWWQIRAKLRGRSEEEERRRVKARRDRTVDIILEEVENFKVAIPEDMRKRDLEAADKAERVITASGVSEDAALQAEQQAAEEAMTADQYAMEQILEMLNKLSLAESLYPNQKAMRVERPLYASEAFQARVDAMTAWVGLIRMLQLQLNRLQKWTGSEELDVTKRNTNAERPLVQQRKSGMIDDPKQKKIDKLADDSTFIERILKEESITNTFKKSAVRGLRPLIENARDTITTHWPMFDALGLSPISKAFHGHILAIIAFPPRLVVEALRVRLRAARKHQAPDLVAVNDNLLNFRRTLEIALRVKQDHLKLVAPHPSGHWNIPPCLGDDYDQTVTESIEMFFRLLQYKLKSPDRNIFFRETDVLEEEWDFLHTVAEGFEGGDVLVTENY